MKSASLFKTGNQTVDLLATYHVQGDVIPPKCYKIIKKDSGKTDMLAVAILSNIIYWNRPTPVFNEQGEQIASKTKFNGRYLQKNYSDYEDMFDKTKREVKASFDVLEELGFIKRHFETITVAGHKIPNVLYIELLSERLGEILDDNDNVSVPEKIAEEVCSESDLSVSDEAYDGQFFVTPPTKICRTNTNTNPEIKTYNLNSFIPSSDIIEGEGTNEEVYREILAENVELERIIADDPQCEDEYREYFEIMVDLVCHNKAPIKSHGQTYPAEVVKSRMLKLKREHLERVASVYEDYVGNITDFYKHCAATLYNSYFEASNTVRNSARNSLYHLEVS